MDRFCEPLKALFYSTLTDWRCGIACVLNRYYNDALLGGEYVHELSKGYKDYTPEETDYQIESVRKAKIVSISCKKMFENGMCRNDKCSKYRSYRTPLDDEIDTSSSGYHHVYFTEKGLPVSTELDTLSIHRLLEDENIIYVETDDEFYRWNGKSYNELDIYQYFHPILKKFTRTKRGPELVSLMANKLKESIQTIKFGIVKYTYEDFVRDESRYIGFENGVLDITSNTIKSHSPQYLIRSYLDFEFDCSNEFIKQEASKKMRIEDTHELMGLSRESVATLEQYIASGLFSVPNEKIEKFLFLSGMAGTGKSTLLDMYARIFPPKRVTNVHLKYFNEPNYLSELRYSQLHVTGEVDGLNGSALASVLKLIATGENITIGDVYKKKISIPANFKLCISGNSIPVFGDAQGIERRMLNIEFSKKISNPDKLIRDYMKTKEEKRHVFTRLYVQYLRLKKNKYVIQESEEVKENIRRYEYDTRSSVIDFAYARLEEAEGEEIQFSIVYDNYVLYCADRKISGVYGRGKFARALRLIPSFSNVGSVTKGRLNITYCTNLRLKGRV